MQIASTATVPVLTEPAVAIESVAVVWHLLVDLLARPELLLFVPAVGGMFDLGGGEDTEADADAAATEDDDGFAGDGDDGMDGMDDWADLDGEDDDWAEDAGGDKVGELEDKVNGLETDLSAVSSSMETVKEENRQLAETVEEADETIRKLLDVYEIVTRGINPFVDDAEAMAAADGSFGLFGDDADEEPIDPDIAGADAESFFDDDFDDFGAVDEPAEAAADGDDEDDDEEADDSEGGASFDDLKAEYDADDGGWEDVVDEEAEEVGEDDGDGSADEADFEDGDETEVDGELEDPEADDAEEWAPLDEDPEPEPEPAAVVDERPPEPPTPGQPSGHDDGRPYLATVPTGYAAELVLLDWARELVAAGDAAGAVGAVRHYERLGWIGEPVRRRLAALATELCDEPTPTATGELGPEHHRRSLEYVSRLAGEPVAGGLLADRGGATGTVLTDGDGRGEP